MTLSNIRNATFPTNGLRNVKLLQVNLYPQTAGFQYSFEVQSGVASNTEIGGITEDGGWQVTAERYPTCELVGAYGNLVIRLWNSSLRLIQEIKDDSVWSFTITDPVVVTFRSIY